MNRSTPLLLVALLPLTACGSGTPTAASTVTQSQSVPASTAPPTSVSPPTSLPATGAASYVMPKLVGKVLQGAQDELQTVVGSFVASKSHDVSGQGRLQVIDSGWQVCDQNLAPGASFSATTTVDLGVVRTSEKCP